MNGLQIYLLGCLLAYPIAIYILKILNEPNKIGLFEQSQKILQQLNKDSKGDISITDKLNRIVPLFKNLYRMLVDASYR